AASIRATKGSPCSEAHRSAARSTFSSSSSVVLIGSVCHTSGVRCDPSCHRSRMRDLVTLNGPQGVGRERYDRKRISGYRRKLDFEPIATAVYEDNAADVTGLEPELRNVPRQRDHLQFAYHLRNSSPGRPSQAATVHPRL